MTTRDYIKCEQVRIWLLSSSLATFQQFYTECFFNFASVKFFLATWFMFSFCPRGLVVLLFCSPYDDWIFWFFLVWNFQTVSALKLIFLEDRSFFVRSVCNHGALKLRLQVVALPASFILNAFFNFASVNFFVATWFMFSFRPWGLVVLLFCSLWEEWNFWIFLSEIFNLFPR